MQQYQALLHRLWLFYSPFEDALLGGLSADASAKVADRRKARWLFEDIQSLGYQSPIAGDPSLPELNSDAERMGALYVLEGATLGGALIRKQLIKTFGDRINGALRFYTGYGSDSSRQWISFRMILSEMFDTQDISRRNDVVAGANATFLFLEAWLGDGDNLTALEQP